MLHKPFQPLRRMLALLLCAAMLCSYIVLPVGAEEAVPTPSLKFSLSAQNANYYQPNQIVLTHTNWLQTLAANNVGSGTLRSFLKTEAVQLLDLMPVQNGNLVTNTGEDVELTFNDDGSVTVTNRDSKGYSHVYMNYDMGVEISNSNNTGIFVKYSGDAYFNIYVTYLDASGNEKSISLAVEVNGQGNGDVAAGGTEGKSLWIPLSGLGERITITKCQYYASNGVNKSVTFSDIRLINAPQAVDAAKDARKGTFMANYYAVIVEYMGTAKTGITGVDGVEYVVDAVIDCAKDFDEEPHQLLAKSDYGFVMYIPKSGGYQVPSRGDLVDATFDYDALRSKEVSATGMTHTLSFYENPTEEMTYAESVDVNATVKLFNYDATINNADNGYNFWNGYWGFGGNAESVDGAGIDTGAHKNPVMSDKLDENGYPQLSNGTSLGYLFNGTNGHVATMSDGGGLFQMDGDGYYYYDSLKNAAYYDSTAGEFVLYDDLIVRPWYLANNGDDYGGNYPNFADAAGDATTYGNFLPFNKVTANNITVDGAVYDQDHNVVLENKVPGSLEQYGLMNFAANKLLAGNKAMNDEAYAAIGPEITSARLEESVDMGFGMTVDFNFYQPQSGKVNGENMVFDFLGDDDVFVYIGVWNEESKSYDYKLVLDIGGSHEAREGVINFATGAVTDWPANSTAPRTRTLKEIFNLEGDTFSDFSKLSLKFFYLERGGNISYCKLQFNMPTLPENSLTISKALDMDVLGTQTYQFRVLKAVLNAETGAYEATDELFIPAGSRYTISGTNQTGTVGEDGYFALTPGQGVTFENVLDLSNGATHYVVEETITQKEVDDQFTIESPDCSINGVSTAVTELDSAENGGYVYRTAAIEMPVDAEKAAARSANTQLVGFTNLVNEAKLGTLRISKKIRAGAKIDPNTAFDMRVIIGGQLLSVGTTYDIINTDTGKVLQEDVKVTRKGYVTIKDGQTAVIDRILSTSTFEVTEITYDTTPNYSSTSSAVKCTNSGASGVMPLGGDITVLVVNSESSGILVDKTVAAGEETDEFMLTLEAFSTGKTSSVSSTTPTDIVLVLDQSASMYTPKGANKDRFDRWNSEYSNSKLTRLGLTDLDPKKGSHLGYYVAQSENANRYVTEDSKTDHNGNGVTGERLPVYDWFIVQYVEGTGWVYVRVADTTTPAVVDVNNMQVYVSSDGGTQYGKTLHKGENDYGLIPGMNYYQSQYSALYESVNDFVEDLVATGVDHRIAITGFASPHYDGIANYNGSGLYINGEYYLYDADYKYWGFATNKNVNGYMLYVETDELYTLMESVLPANLKEITWTRTLPDGVTKADLIRMDPNKSNDGAQIIAGGTTYKPGHYFAAFPASGVQMTYNPLTANEYAHALMPISTTSEEGTTVHTSVTNSIEAIRTNYMQTCPAAGLDMAQKIFAADTSTGRDKIVILFTDGVPTVSLNASREYGESQNAGFKETYYSGLSGVKDAVNLAKQLKDGGIQIYTIGTSALEASAGHAPNVPVITSGFKSSSVTGELFLEYVSSDYQGITATHTVKTPGQDTTTEDDDDNTRLSSSVLTFYQNEKEITAGTPAEKASTSYAKTAADGDFSVVFGQIMQSVSTPNVTLGEEAVLKEVLSDYFDLKTVDTSKIEVYVAPYTGTNTIGDHTFSEPVLASEKGFGNISVSFDGDSVRENVIVNVTGFSYSENYVRNDLTTGDPLGYKIIVKVPIKARPGFWGGNNVPTNKDTTAIYDGTGNQVQPFPMPEANVPMRPALVAEDKTVYYGSEVHHADLLTGVTVGGWPVNVGDDGSLTPSQDWMDDYADLNWDSRYTNPKDPKSPVSGTEAGDYTYGVILTPKPGMTGESNLTENDDNIAGAPIDAEGFTSEPDTGRVEILVPVITFEDSTIWVGDVTDKTYYEDTNRLPTISWVNKDDPYGTEGKPTEPSEGFETEPALNLVYSPEGTGDNRFTEDTPVNVEVMLGSTNITNESYFDWVNCQTNHKHDSQIIVDTVTSDTMHRHKGDVSSYEFYIHVICMLNEDTVVIDFGIPVDIDVLFNDVLPAGGTLTGVKVGSTDSKYYSNAADATFLTTAESDHGSLTLQDDGKLRYTPSDMKMDASETFIYEVKFVTEGKDAQGQTVTTTRYYHSTVIVIPATVIYYEDNFLNLQYYTYDSDGNYEEPKDGGWTQVPEGEEPLNIPQDQDRPGDHSEDALKQIDADNIYGYDQAYTDMATYSFGTARKIRVYDGLSGLASFSFTGTGFDVISLSSNTTGTLLVSITDADGDYVASYMVDTYYGYKFVDGEWVVDTEASDTLYQVPVIKVDLTQVEKRDPVTYEGTGEYYGHGTYNVEIDVSYVDWLNHEQCKCEADCDGCYEFYLDAIRIYNPANDGSGDERVEDAYIKDHEYLPTYQELRNQLITAKKFTELAGEAPGIVFIDNTVDDIETSNDYIPGIADYTNYGPNNELYLAKGQAVSFNLNDAEDIDRVHLALKSVGGSAKISLYGVKAGEDNVYVLNDAQINTATDLYYDITSLIGKTVVIKNSGDSGILSITNVKTTHLFEQKSEGYSLFTIDRVGAAMALASLSMGEPDPIEPDRSGVVTPKTAAVSFEDEVKVNIFFTLELPENVKAETMGMITFDTQVENGTLENAQNVYTDVAYNAVDGRYYVSTDGIPAKKMGDLIWFRVFAELSDGTVAYSKLLSYSPKQYAYSLLNREGYSPEVKALVAAMLNYGAAAQTFFDYRTDALVNADMTEAQRALAGTYSKDMFKGIQPHDAAKTGVFGSTPGGFTKKSPAVSFLGAFSISYFMTTAHRPDSAPTLYIWTQADYDAAKVLTAENASAVLTMTGDGTYTAAADGIAAKDLNATVYAAAVYEAQGTTWCTGILPYSIGAYFANQAAKDGEAVQPLAQAAAVYASCAEAYFYG